MNLSLKIQSTLFQQDECIVKENHEYLEKIMISCLQDKTLLWILSKNHSHAKNEYDIATIKDNKIMRYRIDRTFICKTGERWIIDYKTTNKPNIELSEFYKIQKKAHLKQLEDYAELFSHEKRNIVLAIYYPKFSGFFSWNYAKQK